MAGGNDLILGGARHDAQGRKIIRAASEDAPLGASIRVGNAVRDPDGTEEVVIEGVVGGGLGGSLLFAQAIAALVTSMPWRASGSVHFGSATLTVAEAVVDAVDVCEIAVNGTTVETLSLAAAATTSTEVIDIDVVEGDLLTVVRIAADGAACQVQLDMGA